MTLQQGLAFGLVLATVACFAWGRFRYDLVALGSLVAGLLLGIIPAKAAFDGFKNDVVLIIAAALVLSAAIARSGVIEIVMRPLLNRAKTEAGQVRSLSVAVTLLSMVTKNVGALAILMPTAMQLSRRNGTPLSRLLMPMSFGSLLGGLVTLVGTSPNIIVSEVRQDVLGKPFGMYDFAPVGLSLTALGLVFLAFGYRILPKSRTGAPTLGAALEVNAYTIEARAPDPWNKTHRFIHDLAKLSEGDVRIVALIRNNRRKASPHANTKVLPGDVLVLEGEQEALEQFVASAKLENVRSEKAPSRAREDVRVVEAVVGADSALIGDSARSVDLYNAYGANLLGVSRSGRTISQRLRNHRFQAGDVLVLQAGEHALPAILRDLGCLPLAERDMRLGAGRSLVAPVVLAAAMVLVAIKVLPVAIAFFAAAVIVVALGGLTMREAYASLDAPVLILIAALVPVSEAVQATGGTKLLSDLLAGGLGHVPPLVVIATIMTTAMISAPFLHNAPTVLILGPVAVGLARNLNLNPDPFLMAVATGAACDFLTPIGHQCNTLVMGPGGYRFSDYPRLGAPLSVLIILVGAPLILLFWPLAPH